MPVLLNLKFYETRESSGSARSRSWLAVGIIEGGKSMGLPKYIRVKKQVKMYRIVNNYDGYDYDDVYRYTLQCLNCKDFFNSDKIPKFCQECGTPFEKEFTRKNRRWNLKRRKTRFSFQLEIWYEARNAKGWTFERAYSDNRKSNKYIYYRSVLTNPCLFHDKNHVKLLNEIKLYKEGLRLLSREVALVVVNLESFPPDKPVSSAVRVDGVKIIRTWKGFDRPDDYYAKFEKGGCSG